VLHIELGGRVCADAASGRLLTQREVLDLGGAVRSARRRGNDPLDAVLDGPVQHLTRALDVDALVLLRQTRALLDGNGSSQVHNVVDLCVARSCQEERNGRVR
jgi:hypothetical protein